MGAKRDELLRKYSTEEEKEKSSGEIAAGTGKDSTNSKRATG